MFGTHVFTDTASHTLLQVHFRYVFLIIDLYSEKPAFFNTDSTAGTVVLYMGGVAARKNCAFGE